MKRLFKSCIAALAVVATTLSAIPAAEAGRWDRGHGYHHKHDRHGKHHRKPVHVERKKSSRTDMVAAGIFGLAAGAIAAGILTQPRQTQPTYIDPPRHAPPPPPRYGQGYHPPAPAYRSPASYAPEPWSREWYRACAERYRSFDPDSGTFMGYDGKRRFCQIQ